jgi:hypothetical protein
MHLRTPVWKIYFPLARSFYCCLIGIINRVGSKGNWIAGEFMSGMVKEYAAGNGSDGRGNEGRWREILSIVVDEEISSGDFLDGIKDMATRVREAMLPGF